VSVLSRSHMCTFLFPQKIMTYLFDFPHGPKVL
jgi:hypothetical protein